MGDAEKRARSAGEGGEGVEEVPRERKRARRWDDAPAAPVVAGGDAPKVAAVLAKQKELALKLQQLKQLKQAQAPTPATEATPAPSASGPSASLASLLPAAALARVAALARGGSQFSSAPPVGAPARSSRPVALRLDALGREVDEQGALIARTTAAAPTLKVNARAVKAVDLTGALERARREIAAEQAASRSAPAPGFDPRFETLQKHSAARQKRGLQFLEPGKLIEAAETSRVAAALREALGGEDAVRKAALRAKRHADELAKAASYEAAGAARQQGADQPASLTENVPDHEPWDAVLLAGASYEDVLSGRAAMAPNKISVYVEHPVPLPPPAEAPPPPPQPLRLTAKEQKKLRTQRRIAKEKERQDMLRQGLLEPPPPKVRIANLMRVLGAEATADPTAVEREVRLQVAERQAAHEDRNAARQLTPQERREKAMRKMFEESHGASDTLCCVYRVERLDSRLNEYKVLLNAEENHLTGAGFKTESFALIIVEGARKAIVRFNKLMLRRMDWALQQQLPGPDDPDDPRSVEACQRAAEEYEAKLEAQGPNKCTLVWQGVVLKPAFKRFKFELIKTAAGTAQYLQELGLRHLWDLAAAGVPIE